MIITSFKSPIGFIDSGIGGLSILNALAHSLDTHKIIYFADAAHLPYGQKSYAFLLERGKIITKFLQNQGVTNIYVACHTLSSTVLPELIKLFPNITYIDCLPPTITAALTKSATKNIGIMATQATITSETHKKLLLSINPECIITTQACPLFVTLIEQQASDATLTPIITEYLQPMFKNKVDTIILGCTHYWFIKKSLEKQAPDITFISAADSMKLFQKTNTPTTIEMITTASVDYIKQSSERYFHHNACCCLSFKKIDI